MDTIRSHTKKRILGALPYIGAVAFFFVVALLYFQPQFQGKRLQMGDVVQYEGMCHDIKQMQQLEGEDPQWAGNAFCGMPAYMINIKYPAMVIKNWSEALCRLIERPAVLILLAMVCFWVMLLLWGIKNPLVAMVGALAYGLSTYSMLIIEAGHITKMFAFAYAPLLLGGVVYTLRGGKLWLGGALTALFAALQIGANHPQITYYFAIVIAALWISELCQAAKDKTLKRFARATTVLVGSAILAVGANLPALYYTAQHQGDTTRGGSELSKATTAPNQAEKKGLDIAYATAWSYGIDESLNLFVPDLMGGSSSGSFASDGQVADSLRPYGARSLATQLPSYWGKQPYTAGPTYLGAVAIFLAVLGMFLLSGRERWWLLGVSIFALLLSWGSNLMWFTEWMFNILPAYNKFRAVSTALVVVQWAVPLLGALVLWRIFRGDYTKKQLLGGLRKALIITGGVAAVLWLLGDMIYSFSAPYDGQMGLPQDVVAAMQAERADMLQGDALRSLIFVLLSGGAVWLYAVGKAKGYAMVAALGVLVMVDMVGVDLRYLSWDDFVRPAATEIKPTEADKVILADEEIGFRVANLAVNTFNDASTSYFHRSVGGYHSAKLSRYQDLIDHQLQRGNPEVYDMLNTKYFIVPDEATGQPVAVLNDAALGAAWMVEDVVWAASAAEEMALLDTTPVEREAILEERYRADMEGVRLGKGKVELVSYKPNHLEYVVETEEGGLVVFSEIFYDKGWEATLNGEPHDYMRANYLLRAMVVPAGTHKVVFHFRAPNFGAVEAVAAMSSAIILGSIVAFIVMYVIRKRKRNNEQ